METIYFKRPKLSQVILGNNGEAILEPIDAPEDEELTPEVCTQ